MHASKGMNMVTNLRPPWAIGAVNTPHALAGARQIKTKSPCLKTTHLSCGEYFTPLLSRAPGYRSTFLMSPSPTPVLQAPHPVFLVHREEHVTASLTARWRSLTQVNDSPARLSEF